MNKQAKTKTVLGEYNSKPEGIQGKEKQEFQEVFSSSHNHITHPFCHQQV